MKRKICVFFVLFAMIFCVQSAVDPVQASCSVSKKAGIVKEKGKYYYYVKGKRQKNVWKTVKEQGKRYRYYFGKSGAAHAGSRKNGAVIPAVKKIGRSTYAFDPNGRMLTGIQVIKGKFYVFSGNGRLDTDGSSELRRASKYKKKLRTLQRSLRKYGAKYKKTKYLGVSYFGNGDDRIVYYDNFMIFTFDPQRGEPVILGVYPRQSTASGQDIGSPENIKSIAASYVGRSMDGLIRAIGQPLNETRVPSCSGPGEDVEYGYVGFVVRTYEENGVRTVLEVV